MPDGKRGRKEHWSATLIKSLPLHKLRRYEVTNLGFELIALYFTVRFSLQQPNQLYSTALIVVVVAMGLLCVMWASKQ